MLMAETRCIRHDGRTASIKLGESVESYHKDGSRRQIHLRGAAHSKRNGKGQLSIATQEQNIQPRIREQHQKQVFQSMT